VSQRRATSNGTGRLSTEKQRSPPQQGWTDVSNQRGHRSHLLSTESDRDSGASADYASRNCVGRLRGDARRYRPQGEAVTRATSGHAADRPNRRVGGAAELHVHTGGQRSSVSLLTRAGGALGQRRDADLRRALRTARIIQPAGGDGPVDRVAD
jgi:hypothetical protein